jgi:uncharacterized protein (TIGR02271 family)
MPTLEIVQTWQGRDLYGADHEKVGEIVDVYLDRQSGEPEWIAVKTGMFGSAVSFVPIRDASEDGDHVHAPYSKARVKDAPKVDADGELSPEEEHRLYDHYGQDWGDFDTGRDTSGPTTDDAMTRSEEELQVGKRREESGRARLRKVVVTEQQHVTVPVQREEVRVEREPITEANAGQAMEGPAISEEEHEMTLHAETPVVEKKAVPKERVRLEKDTVTEEQTVSDEVRKERIDTEGGDAR